MEATKKKGKSKAGKKPSRSPGKRNRAKKVEEEEENASSLSDSQDSEATLSADIAAAAKEVALEEPEMSEAPGQDAQKIDALYFNDDEVNSPSIDVDEEIQADAPPTPRAARPELVVDRDLSFAQEEIQEFFGEFPLPHHVFNLVSNFLRYMRSHGMNIYKVCQQITAKGSKALIEDEASVLRSFQLQYFNDLINELEVWRLIEANV